MSKPTLVLSSGGQRSAYIQGFVKAVGFKDWKQVFGISAGAMLGALVVQTNEKNFQDEMNKLMNQHVEILKPHNTLGSILNMASAFLWHVSIFKSSLKEIISLMWKDEQHDKLVVGAYNVTNGDYEMFENPDINKVVASASIPVVFPSVRINECDYVDGAVAHIIPIEEIKEYYEGGDVYVMVCYPTDHTTYKESMKDNRAKLLGRVYSTIDESTWNNMNRDLDELADYFGLSREKVRTSGQYKIKQGTLYMFFPEEICYIDLGNKNYHLISKMQQHGMKVASRVMGINGNGKH